MTINQAGDTYDVVCSCSWKAEDVGDLESAGEVLRIHLGDDHCPDCGAVVSTPRVCLACDAAAYNDGSGAA